MSNDKITDRIRKLLELSRSDNEHEAAQAAARAAELMSEHAVTEAMLQVTGEDDAANAHVKERIEHDRLPDAPERRVAWRDCVASAVATSVDCEVYLAYGKMYAMGRESSVSAWKYMSTYLFAEIDRLADQAWLTDGADLAAVGQTPRAWKGAFRLGAADVVASRLYVAKRERAEKERSKAQDLSRELSDRGMSSLDLAGETEAGMQERGQVALVRVNSALEVMAKDRAEVKDRYEKLTKGWKATRTIGAARGRSGYRAGRQAGNDVRIDAPKGALKAGK